MEKIEIEVTRSNVSLATFLSAIKTACKAKGIDFDFDIELFENPPGGGSDSRYYVKNGKITAHYDGFKIEKDASEATCAGEVCRLKPLDYHVYIKNFDGTFYNEICEFTFWDEKKGSGYYYRESLQ